MRIEYSNNPYAVINPTPKKPNAPSVLGKLADFFEKIAKSLGQSGQPINFR
jgi:hypothetical protein